VTGDSRWRSEAWSAFNWFLGDNDLQLPLYDSVTGGCRDGLHPERVNENQGAESTLSFLMALLEMRSLQNPENKRKSFMTVPAEKIREVESTRFEPLLLSSSLEPILTSKGLAVPINSVFNAGATLLADGTTLLLCRVEDRRGLSHLCAARSRNGVDGWQIDGEPTLMPDPKNIRKRSGALKILASHSSPSCSNTWSPTPRIRAAGPACRWL
jgi:hypothetical protein